VFEQADEAEQNPLVSEADVIGLYRPDIAAAASKWTSTIGQEPAGCDD